MKTRFLISSIAVMSILSLLTLPSSSAPFIVPPMPSHVELLAPQVIQELHERAFVVTDANGVPHIFAENTHDLYVLTGYLHARDRLFQMDVTRHQASGTLAELLGPAALASDVQLRTLGLRRAAELTEGILLPEASTDVAAYADGVNAYIQQVEATKQLPPEYGFLELTHVDPWTPTDSIVVGKAIVFDQSLDIDAEDTLAFLAYVTALNQVGLDGAALYSEDLFRSAPASPATSIPDAKGIATRGTTSTSTSPLKPTIVRLLTRYINQVKDLPFFHPIVDEERGGSNWFVISGEHTASGAPIIANDPHLSLMNPAIWYEMDQKVKDGRELDVAGVGLPGVPYVTLGHTRNIAWVPTRNPMDVTDMFSEQIVQGENGQLQSFFRGQLEPVEVIPESYRMNIIGDGIANNVTPAPPNPAIPPATLIIPRHGPIVSLDAAAGDAISIQFTGFYATSEVETFRQWNHAQNLDDFQVGLRYFEVGTFNWGYADTSGNIGYFTSAKMPLREDLQQGFVDRIPPFFVRDGTGTLQHQWIALEPPPTGFLFPHALNFEILSAEEMPQIVNPPSGFIVNANNDPTGITLDNNPLNQYLEDGSIYYLNRTYDLGFRAGRLTERIREEIEQGRLITVEDAMSFLADTTQLAGRSLAPYLIAAIQAAQAPGAPKALTRFAADPLISQVAEILKKWSFNTPTGITEGFDFGRHARQPPSEQQINDSIATTIFNVWASRLIANTIDGVLGTISSQLPRPPSESAIKALLYLLENFETNTGEGASGLPLFNVPGLESAPTSLKRDLVLLKSLKDALDLLASDAFSSAFQRSGNLDTYRWGKIHTITFEHLASFGGPFNLPNDGAGFPTDGAWQVPDRSDNSIRGAEASEFAFRAGPSRRYVAELRPTGIRAFQVLPGGQSGVLGARHYGDQLPLWLSDAYHPLLTDKLAIYQSAESWQDFLPLYARPASP